MLLHMKRTTLLLDSTLYTELKRRATAEQRTLTDVIESTLRAGLRVVRNRAPRRVIPSYDLGPYLEDPGTRQPSDPREPRDPRDPRDPSRGGR